jgi:hypothetical protein
MQSYFAKRLKKRFNQDRKCKSCGSLLSAYNDGPVCFACSVNPSDVTKALKEIKGMMKDENK